MLSRDDVVWAYRLFLGREPENEQVISHAQTLGTRDALLRAFFDSPEFSAKFDRGLIHHYTDVTEYNTQVVCRPDQRDRMLARISAAWQNLGNTQPHWSVLTNEIFRPDKISANVDLFYRSCEREVKLVTAILSRSKKDIREIESVLDFGCGVGRLSLGLAELFPKVLGVDISQPHLQLAASRAQSTRVRNVTFRQISDISDLDNIGTFDLVVSFLVLQHNPPPVTAEIIRKLLGSLNRKGTAIFQVPTFIHGYSFDAEEYLRDDTVPAMEMHAIPQQDVFAIAGKQYCTPLEVRENDMIGTLGGISQTFAFVHS